jgi:DNA-binding winged helix-turn-helix (wHTH) protein
MLERDGAVVVLTPKAFDVLTFLVVNAGRTVTKEEMLKGVWPGSFVEEGNLAQHVSSLRKALGDRSGLIVTVPGRGYQFAAQVENTDAKSPIFRNSPGGVNGVVVQRVRERMHVVVTESVDAAEERWTKQAEDARGLPVPPAQLVVRSFWVLWTGFVLAGCWRRLGWGARCGNGFIRRLPIVTR